MNEHKLSGRLASVAVVCALLWLGSFLFDQQQPQLDAVEWPHVIDQADGDFNAASITSQFSPDIKVHLVKASKNQSVDLELIGNYRILNHAGKTLRKGISLQNKLELAPDGLHLGAWLIIANPVFIESSGDAGIRIGSRTYRGKLEISFSTDKNRLPDKLKLSLHVPLEDYVLGVVCGELPSNTPGIAAALRAQAIAARTYALWKRGQGKSELRDDTADQHFESVDFETTAARQAVLSTQGQVLSWDQRLLAAWYHADCGGSTTNALSAGFGKQDMPPLKGQLDPGCELSHTWEKSVPVERLDKLAQTQGLGDWIKRIQFRSRDRGGRLLKVELIGELNNCDLMGENLRAAFRLPSANWTSMQAMMDGSLRIRGRGNGHGVGMCQTGSLRMAKAGNSTNAILQHYYPSAVVQDYSKLINTQ